MFYRYEAKDKNGQFKGIFVFFNPSERRYFNRFLKDPKWYEKNPDVESKCWFTEEGYTKYHSIIEKLICEKGRSLEIRLLTKNTLNNVACKGKMQRIEITNNNFEEE